LFEIINNYHPKIKFTVEENPNRFLDASMEILNGKANTSVYRKPNKPIGHHRLLNATKKTP